MKPIDTAPAPHERASSTTAGIAGAGLIAILRAPTTEHFPAITETLLAAGVQTVEITLTTPGALDAIATLAKQYGSAAIIGAGTVVTADQAEACIDAGAAFLVSPTTAPDVIAAARIAGVAAYPGALTPTEMLAATRAGASAVKLFPASAVRPRFITDLHGPFPDIAIIPTGGIQLPEIGAWLRAGATAVGLGTPLIGSAAIDGVDRELAERARQAVDMVAEARQRR